MAPGGVEASCEFATRSITGTGGKTSRDMMPMMPCGDEKLSGKELQAKLEAWVASGVIEGDVAAAVAELHANPEMLKAARSKVWGLAERVAPDAACAFVAGERRWARKGGWILLGLARLQSREVESSGESRRATG